MEGKLQELTQKVYQEGVEKARAEGQTIVDQARKEAETLLAKAKNEAAAIVEKARQEAAAQEQKTLSEMRMASSQALTALKQEITAALSKAALSDAVKNGLSDAAFLQKVVLEMAGRMGAENLEVVFPASLEKEMTSFFKSKAADLLAKGFTVSFESRMNGGFKIGPKDHSYILSFTEEDLTAYFASFLKPRSREILFPGV